MPGKNRIVPACLLLVYLYSLAGYIAVFYIVRTAIQHEISEHLDAERVDESTVTLAFHTRRLELGDYNLRWFDDREFRYNGSMYDIISREQRNDTTFFVCLQDEKETRLYAAVEVHITIQTGEPDSRGSLTGVRSPVLETLPLQHPPEVVLQGGQFFPMKFFESYTSAIPEIIPPPPRHLITAFVA